MVLSSKVLTFTANTATGTQDLTGTSFTPKAAFVWYSAATNTVDTFTENAAVGFGFTDGTNSRSSTITSEDNQTQSDTGRLHSDAHVIITLNLTGTVETIDSTATFSSWLSNGMQINWTDAPAAAFKFHVLFLGGSDITDVNVGTITVPAAAGDQDITTPGFSPDLVIFLTPGSTATFNETAGTNAGLGIGAASSSGQWHQYINWEDGRATTDTWQFYTHVKCIVLPLISTGVDNSHASYSGGVSGGFRINWSSVGTSTGADVGYLAIKGGSYAVGNSTEPGSTGNQTVTTSKDTNAVMIFGVDIGTPDNEFGGSMMTVGAGTSSSEMSCLVLEDTTAAADSVNVSRYETDSIYLNITSNATASSSTIDDEASLSSVSSTGFVLNWSNIGNARPFRYITFGSSSAGTLFTRDITETAITVSDSLARQLNAFRTLSDTVTVSDSLTRRLSAFRTLTETSIVVSDSLARVRMQPRTISEPAISVSDALVRTFYAFRTSSEPSISVSDSLARKLTALRSISEASISVSDSLNRLFTALRTLSETSIAVSDSVDAAKIGGILNTRNITEATIAVSDAVARMGIYTRTLSEPSISVSDTVNRFFTALRTLSEASIAVSDSVARIRLQPRTLSEPAITVSDTLARLATLKRSISEAAIAVSDSLTRILIASRTISEASIAVSDTLTRIIPYVRSLSDTVIVSDSLARSLALFRSITEPSISVSDSLTKFKTGVRTISEPAISVSDTLNRTPINVRSIAENAIFVSDLLTKIFTTFRTISEPAISVADARARLLSAFRTLTEPSISVSDTVSRQVVPIVLLSEPAISVSDTLIRLYTGKRSLSDTVTVSPDVLNSGKIRIRTISEAAIVVSDTFSRRLFAKAVIGEIVYVSDVLLIVGPDYEVALYVSDRGYSNPLRARIQFISRAEPYPVFYTYDSFNPDARPFNIVAMSVRLAQGEIGAFSMTIEDSADLVDKSKIGLGVKVVIEVRKEFAHPYFKLMTGFVRRIRPLRPATGALLYQIDGYGSQVIFNERIVNFKRAAKRTGIESAVALTTDSRMQAYRLFTDLITATDILPIKTGPSIQSTGRFELTEVSPEVTDFIAQMAPGLTDAAAVANALAEITGAIWGTDSNGNPFFRYPTQKHSGILVKDAPTSTDLAAHVSVNLDAFDFDDSIDVSEGFANRLYVLNSVDTKSTASSSKGLGSTTLTFRGIAQQWEATDNNVTSAAFILSRVGNPVNQVSSNNVVLGKLRADNAGYPTGATLASFEIPVDQIETSKSTIFVNDLTMKEGVIAPGQKYWWYLLGYFTDDSNTIRWHHDNDLATPNRLSASLPLVDLDPTKPGVQATWQRSVFGPVYSFSTFSSVRHILTQSDSESIKNYGLIEGIVDLPAFNDDATFQKALAKIIYTSAKPKRTYQYNRLTIPTQRIFYPGELITLIDSKAKLTSEKNVNAEIAEVSYNFDTSSNAIGCKYVDIRLIAFLDKALDDYMDTREC